MRLNLTLQDQTGKLEAVVFGALAEKLFGYQLTSSVISKGVQNDQLPEGLKRIIDEEYIFTDIIGSTFECDKPEDDAILTSLSPTSNAIPSDLFSEESPASPEHQDMLNLTKFHNPFNKTRFFKTLSNSQCRNFTSPPNPSPNSSKNVAIFWDLDNKPPKSSPPFDAAIRLKKAAQKFGFVKYMIAYANRHAFSYVPPSVREQRRTRKALNRLETTGLIKPVEPYVCRVCGRRFYNNDKLINHFKQIHEREQTKRMNRIESARGKRRARMAAQYAMKMDKYKNAARDILTPKTGYGLADELKRAGFWVRTVSDEPQAANVALRNHMVGLMDRQAVDCLFLVSDDSDFNGVLKEARMRCLKTVVVGDVNEGCLKRTADWAFSWEEIMIGKAKTEAVTVVGKWKDRNVLGRLEWAYDPERERKLYYEEIESDGSDMEEFGSDECGPGLGKEGDGAWWELETRAEGLKRGPE
ncbi:hypothetical protein PHJA_002868300 [Phtheirospermum japonicum]|uniref:C2H2-type domain-containing protein n=1 Tax=Phtheirospermum japonicum TaxID=374723 RepID=A0A830DN86_9LAMI|nr:hypothetical protein PHJA_002868300 [Phtheirospermum japonicum]